MLWKKLEGTQFTYKYHLKKLLGVGGFGAVFSADEVIGDTAIREVAVKIMQVDPDNKKRQLDELVTSTGLKHPALLDCFSPEQAQIEEVEYWGLVMELATQGSLVDYLKKQTLAHINLKPFVKQVSEGLQYLHSKGIVHRDIKPANILSVDNTWKIADFGIARMLDIQKSMTATSAQMGTKIYMPPESYDGEVRFAWDWWSLGIVIIEAFTGEFAFGEYTTENELMKKVLMDEPTIPDTLSPSLQEIVKGCLIKDPQQRWSAQQILKALTPVPPHSTNYQEMLPNGVILDMVSIARGSFMMGRGFMTESSDPNTYENSEKPEHWVNIAQPFYIGKYSITQEQYYAVMNENSSQFQTDLKLPVESVSWTKAIEFCTKLSNITAKRYRLPSEAEWEYACRSGSKTKYYFGDNEQELEKYAWYNDNSNSKTHRVGEKLPNQWGLYDMYGNVWEWCLDPWHDNYNDAPNNQGVWDYKNETPSNNTHILRGGSWHKSNVFCSSFNRYRNHPNVKYGDNGFRVVCDLT